MKVSELNLKAKALLEAHFDNILLSGELATITMHSSGHWYFDLKDENSSISCIMFRANNTRLSFKPQVGDMLELSGNLSLYAESGRYQFIAKNMQKSGLGDLEQQFLQLKDKLEKEGLFDEELKKKPNKLPKKVGIITSFTSAALEDMLKLIKQKEYFLAKFYIFNALTQGLTAPTSIIKALHKADAMKLDFIIIARGGGSKQDLFCFNDENLAREIFKAKTPIVSAIGHEIDYVISDFVADLRAPTPSAAINLLFHSKNDLEQRLDILQNSLRQDMQTKLNLAAQELLHCEKLAKTASLQRLIKQKIQSLILLKKQLSLLINSKLNSKKSLIKLLEGKLTLHKVFFAKSENLVSLRKNGKILKLKSLKSGDVIELCSVDDKKEAKIL